jgi:hypothetical protein
LISNKPRDSLTKTPGLTGTRGFHPLDHDLTVWTLPICDLILIVRYGLGGWRPTRGRGRRWVAGLPFPWWRFAGVGRSRPSRLHFGRGLAREVEHDTANTSSFSRWPIRVRFGAPHGGGGTSSRHRGELTREEGKGEGKRARRDPYHP